MLPLHSYCQTDTIAKPRLLILAIELPELQTDLRWSLFSRLCSRVAGVEVAGSVASPYSINSLLNWAVLGRSTSQDHFLGGCSKRMRIIRRDKNSRKRI